MRGDGLILLGAPHSVGFRGSVLKEELWRQMRRDSIHLNVLS